MHSVPFFSPSDNWYFSVIIYYHAGAPSHVQYQLQSRQTDTQTDSNKGHIRKGCASRYRFLCLSPPAAPRTRRATPRAAQVYGLEMSLHKLYKPDDKPHFMDILGLKKTLVELRSHV